jgi:hypothetical protein
VCQPVLFFRRVLINPSAHIPFDLEGFHLPLISYVAQSVRHGFAPLWDPYTYGGMPIYADSQAQVFYPLNWLAILAGNLSQGRALFYWVQLLVPLHMVLGGVFTFWLLRRMGAGRPAALFGATVYQLGAFFASQAQHLGAISAAAWLPLAALAIFEMRIQVRLRWIAVLALAVAMSILAGFVAASLVVAMALVLIIAAWLALREARWPIVPAAAAGILLAVLIASVELIPLWQLTQLSVASERGDVLMNGEGLPLESLVSLVRPDFYHIFEPAAGYKLPYNYTFLYTYCGIATVFLLALAPFLGRARERTFFIVTVVCAFWMLGEHTPVYHSIYTRLPSLFRGSLYANYALIAFCFFAGVTGALMLDRFRGRVPAAMLWAVALATGYDLIHTGSNRPMNSFDGNFRKANSEYRLAGQTGLLEELRKLVNLTYPPSRIDYLDDTLEYAIQGGMFRLPTTNGDNPFMLRRMRSLRRLFCRGRSWDRRLYVDRLESQLLRMLNTAWIVGAHLPEGQAAKPGLEYLETLGGATIYTRRALPRFFLTSRIRRSPDESATFQMLNDPTFNPAEEAIVEGIPDGWHDDRAGLAQAPISVKSYTPNRVELSVQISGPAFLATSEILYPGWEAQVDGRSQPLWMTNGAFRGLALPAGARQIVMEYHPPYLRFSLWLSGLLFLVTLAAGVRGERLWHKPAWFSPDPPPTGTPAVLS